MGTKAFGKNYLNNLDLMATNVFGQISLKNPHLMASTSLAIFFNNPRLYLIKSLEKKKTLKIHIYV